MNFCLRMSLGGLMMRHIRHGAVMRIVAAALAALGLAVSAPAVLAQAKEVKVGLIAPLSGPWARQGALMLQGAQMAIDDINNGGGLTSIGGGEVRLLSPQDRGSTRRRQKTPPSG